MLIRSFMSCFSVATLTELGFVNTKQPVPPSSGWQWQFYQSLHNAHSSSIKSKYILWFWRDLAKIHVFIGVYACWLRTQFVCKVHYSLQGTNRYHNTSSVETMLQQQKWPTQEERREKARYTLLYKVANGEVKRQCNLFPNTILQDQH